MSSKSLLRQSVLRGAGGGGDVDLSLGLGASAMDMGMGTPFSTSDLTKRARLSQSSVSPIPPHSPTRTTAPVPSYTFSTQAEVKVWSVKWLQSKFHNSVTVPDPGATEYFLTGSWGEVYQNEVGLWKLMVASTNDNEEDQDLAGAGAAGVGGDKGIPDIQKICGMKVFGHVTGITTISGDTFAISSSSGDIHLFQADKRLGQFERVLSLPVHKLKSGKPCPATHLTSTPDSSILSVGEDGGIFEINLTTGEIGKNLPSADQISLTQIQFLHTQSLFATGNGCGQVKIWDLRTFNSGSTSPTTTLNHLGELASVSSIGPHPGRPHLMLVGYNSSGNIDLWDSRNPGEPVISIERQNGPINALGFHPIVAENFYSGAGSGELRHWFPGGGVAGGFEQPENLNLCQDIDFIRDGSGLTYKSLYTSAFPINSFDLSWNNRIVTSGDSGMIYYSQL